MKCKVNIVYSLVFLTGVALMSCGGGSGSETAITTPKDTDKASTDWVKDEYLASATFKDKCEVPRTGPDSNGQTFFDQQGSAQHEKMWLRSMTNETYLWYQEVYDVDPSPYPILTYFNRLKTQSLTSSGLPKDRFHFALSTEEANQYYDSGVLPSFGISWKFVRTVPPRRWIVQFVEPNSPAALAGISRGFELNTVNDIDFVNVNSQSQIDSLLAATNPSSAGVKTKFSFRNLQGQTIQTELTSRNINLQPVQNVKVFDKDSARVGYMRFNSHISVAQDGLVAGFQQFVDENVTELVLDLRYNQGGLLDMAAQVAYMIAGDAQTDKQAFVDHQTNGKLESSQIPFHKSLIDWDNYLILNEQPLPSLELTQVVILTSNETCSASEAIINGLRGVDVEVVLIGEQTCGKPYSFFGFENCGTTYFTIQAKGANAKGFSDFADGFKPNIHPAAEDEILGCEVADDFSQPLGSDKENLLASALHYIQTGECLAELNTVQSVESEKAELGIAVRQADIRLQAIKLEHQLNSRLKPLRVNK